MYPLGNSITRYLKLAARLTRNHVRASTVLFGSPEALVCFSASIICLPPFPGFPSSIETTIYLIFLSVSLLHSLIISSLFVFLPFAPAEMFPSRSLLAASLLNLAAAIPSELQNVLKNTHGGSEYGYPTDFTRGIMPVCFSLHSIALWMEGLAAPTKGCKWPRIP